MTKSSNANNIATGLAINTHVASNWIYCCHCLSNNGKRLFWREQNAETLWERPGRSVFEFIEWIKIGQLSRKCVYFYPGSGLESLDSALARAFLKRFPLIGFSGGCGWILAPNFQASFDVDCASCVATLMTTRHRFHEIAQDCTKLHRIAQKVAECTKPWNQIS